jgi:hypothetical protein
MDSHVEFTDLRGRKYVYSVHRYEDHWAAVPGNYIFARRTNDGWIPLYIGETPNLQRRMSGRNDAWTYCCNRGASFVLAHVNFEGDRARQDEERALILAFDPPGNFPIQPESVHLPNLGHAA